MLRLRTAANS